MPIEYLTGDATAPPYRPALIAHIVNDVGRWGRGFVRAVSERWNQPEAYYRRWHTDIGLTLGETLFVPVEDGLVVANMVAQHDIAAVDGVPPIRYPALKTCLRTVGREARQRGAVVVMPRIGCGLAGGTWDMVEPILARALPDVRVTVFDLPT